MARIRSVKPEACHSEDLAHLSDAAERTFVRLWTHADDEGRGKDNPKLLKAALFPLNDEKTPQVVHDLMQELADAGLVVRYCVRGRRYFCIPTFTDHQSPRHPTPSKFPGPEEADDSLPAIGGTSTAGRRKPHAVVGVGVGGGDVGVDVDAEFETFWQAYPKRDGKKVGKQATRMLFRKLTAAERERALTGARNLAASGRMPKDPERFLKRDRAGVWLFDEWQEQVGVTPLRQSPAMDEHGTFPAEM